MKKLHKKVSAKEIKKLADTIIVPKGTIVKEQTKMDALIQEVKIYSEMLKAAKEDVKNHASFLKSEIEKAK